MPMHINFYQCESKLSSFEAEKLNLPLGSLLLKITDLNTEDDYQQLNGEARLSFASPSINQAASIL